MKRLLCAVILIAVLLSGCQPESEVGEQVIVTGLGIDGRDGRWTLSIQAVEALRTAGSLSEQSEAATAVYTADGESVAGALQAFLNETGKRTYILQNQIIVLSLEHCRDNNLFQILDYFIRNQEGRSLVDLVVCRGDPAALLDITTGSDAIPAEYVSQLLEEGSRYAQCVTTHLLDAERALSGMYDAALPLLEVVDGTPRLSGTALFCHGVLVGELTMQETTGLLLAAGESEHCLYTLDNTTFRLEEIKTTLTIRPSGEGWHYDIQVSAVSRVIEEGEVPGSLNPSELPLLRRVEEAVASNIEAALTRAVKELNSDPLGLARRTAADYRNDGVTQRAVRASLADTTFAATVTLSHTDSGFLKEQ